MKIIAPFIVLLFGLNLTVCCQALPGEKDKYEFLSWYIKTHRPKKLDRTLQRVANFGFAVTDIDGLSEKQSSLTRADKQYLKRQAIADTILRTIDTNLIVYNNWKKKSDPALPLTRLSMPIFSKNRKMALINISYFCGEECGEGGVQFFVKIKGKWQQFPLDGISHWIS